VRRDHSSLFHFSEDKTRTEDNLWRTGTLEMLGFFFKYKIGYKGGNDDVFGGESTGESGNSA